MKTIVFTFLILINPLIACTAQNNLTNQFRVSISDEFVAETIRKYVSENNIDIKKKIITINAEVGIKRIFEITNYFSVLYKESRFTPTYYAILDNSIVVLVFTRVEQTFKKDPDHIVKEIDRVLADHEITLSKDTHLNYSAPAWRLVERCDGAYRLIKNITPFEFESIPCDYSIKRDSVKLDSLILIKK